MLSNCSGLGAAARASSRWVSSLRGARTTPAIGRHGAPSLLLASLRNMPAFARDLRSRLMSSVLMLPPGCCTGALSPTGVKAYSRHPTACAKVASFTSFYTPKVGISHGFPHGLAPATLPQLHLHQQRPISRRSDQSGSHPLPSESSADAVIDESGESDILPERGISASINTTATADSIFNLGPNLQTQT